MSVVDHPVRTEGQDRSDEPSCFFLETGKKLGFCRIHQFRVVGNRRHTRTIIPPRGVMAKSASAAADQQSADRRASCHSADPLSGKASLPTARHIRVSAIPARGLYPPAATRPRHIFWV